jgi:hypothetical protein
MRAYVIALVEDAREKHVCCGKSEEYSEITLRIADCNDQIELYFDMDTVEDRENSLHKIRTLAEVINEFKRGIEIEVEVMNARKLIPKHARAASAVH